MIANHRATESPPPPMSPILVAVFLNHPACVSGLTLHPFTSSKNRLVSRNPRITLLTHGWCQNRDGKFGNAG
jgi:hypothetical protein